MMWDYLAWNETDPIPDEWVWERLRNQRNQLLTLTDWRMVSDAQWDTTPWGVYRQELRDLPDTVTDPRTVTWPTPPEG